MFLVQLSTVIFFIFLRNKQKILLVGQETSELWCEKRLFTKTLCKRVKKHLFRKTVKGQAFKFCRFLKSQFHRNCAKSEVLGPRCRRVMNKKVVTNKCFVFSSTWNSKIFHIFGWINKKFCRYIKNHLNCDVWKSYLYPLWGVKNNFFRKTVKEVAYKFCQFLKSQFRKNWTTFLVLSPSGKIVLTKKVMHKKVRLSVYRIKS